MAEFTDGRIVDQRRVPVGVAQAFETVATGLGLQNWFPLKAEVEPRVGGRCLLSWGEGCEGEAPVHAYSDPRTASNADAASGSGARGHFGWTESYPGQDGGEPTIRTVDFFVGPAPAAHVEPGPSAETPRTAAHAEPGAAADVESGPTAHVEPGPVAAKASKRAESSAPKTVVRLVHSGFSEEPSAGEVDPYLQGWSNFMQVLEFYLTHHYPKERRLVWHYEETGGTREEAWEALVGDRRCSGGLVSLARGLEPGAPVTFVPAVKAANTPGGPKLHAAVGRLISAKPGGHFAMELPVLGKSLLFVEFEDTRVGVWLSTWGLAEPLVERLQTALNSIMVHGGR